ncbi:MAG: serine/threonine-protein kinase [Wenzhouxiangella sp.]|jgi:serine/threonine-protein kinase|nr:serine/threonine-protein kinase [Wenzhouxiangella sp.]
MSSNQNAQAALALFSKALDLPESERSDWLDEQTAGDDSLRADVQRLLEADRDSGDFLESSVAFSADRSGEQLGAFEIIELAATGGMSQVYRGRRVDGAFDQQVAIKLFDGRLLSADARARFEAERRIVAALEHPGLARVIDGGATPDGTPYLIMEWVDGEPITRYCSANALDLSARIALVIGLCEALEVAHRRGIVHRDIKPGNVLVDRRGHPKLIDFGVAKVLTSSKIEVELPETRVGTAMMTPEYASPEQLKGGEVAPTSDVYSLGVLLYELLTGVRPNRLAGMSPAEMERSVLETVPADPSQAVARQRLAPPQGLGSARALRQRLRGDLDRIVMTAMRREPERRYGSAQTMAEDLARYLEGKPIVARGASRGYRAWRFVDRHRAVVGATALVIAALSVSLFVVRMQAEETRLQRDLARLEAERARSARDFLIEMIGRADPFENAAEPTLAGSLKLAIPGIEDRFAGQPVLEADLRHAIGYALQNLGDVGAAREQLDRSLQLREDTGGAFGLAEVHASLGLVDWWDSDFEAGEQRFEQALELLQGNTEQTAQTLRVQTLANWSAMMIDAGENAKSEALALEALQAAEGAESVSQETLASIWSSIATARDGLGRSEEALEAFERTRQLQLAATGEMHPSYAIVLNNLALMYHGMGRLEDATEAMQRSVEIRRATLGSSHPQTATALFNLARLQTLAGRLDAAEQHAREALTVATNGYPAGHPRIGKAHEALAIVLQAKDRAADAIGHAELALSIYQEAPGVDPAWISAAQSLIAALRTADSD